MFISCSESAIEIVHVGGGITYTDDLELKAMHGDGCGVIGQQTYASSGECILHEAKWLRLQGYPRRFR